MRIGVVALVVFAAHVPLVAGQTRLSAACQEGDQPACAQLARLGTTADIRLAAVRRLTDQTALTALAMTGADRALRMAAIRGLITDGALTTVAREHKGAAERGAAIERLRNQAVIVDIARHDASRWVRRKAANCLTDGALIAALVAENRRELLPTMTTGAGLKHVSIDGKEIKDTLLGISTLLPGPHTIDADFIVQENVTWEEGSVTSLTLDARLGTDYLLEAEIGIVSWDYLAPKTRRGSGTWTLVVKEEVSAGPDLLPGFLRR